MIDQHLLHSGHIALQFVGFWDIELLVSLHSYRFHDISSLRSKFR